MPRGNPNVSMENITTEYPAWFFSMSTRPRTDVGTVAESEEPVTHEHTSEPVSEVTEAESTTRRFPFTLPDFGSTSPAEDEDAA